MAEITLLDSWSTTSGQTQNGENWYAEPFTKRTGCQVPGQCSENCNCGCPYTAMTDTERLPLIEEIAKIFPNEWLAFIISPEEDDEMEPVHGKLVAHSPNPDELFDAVNTVLWNQHVYTFFNGSFEAMQASYGERWDQAPQPAQRTYSGPRPAEPPAKTPPEPLPDGLVDLVYRAIDHLYGTPDLNQAIRCLRLARVKAAGKGERGFTTLLDGALDRIEGPLPRINEIIWYLEEGLVDLESAEPKTRL